MTGSQRQQSDPPPPGTRTTVFDSTNQRLELVRLSNGQVRIECQSNVMVLDAARAAYVAGWLTIQAGVRL